MASKGRYDYLFALSHNAYVAQLRSMGFSRVHYGVDEALQIFIHAKECLKREITPQEVEQGALRHLLTQEDYEAANKHQEQHEEHIAAIEAALKVPDKDITEIREEIRKDLEANPGQVEPELSLSKELDDAELGAYADPQPYIKHLKDMQAMSKRHFSRENFLTEAEAQVYMIGACRMYRCAAELMSHTKQLEADAWGHTEVALTGANARHFFALIKGEETPDPAEAEDPAVKRARKEGIAPPPECGSYHPEFQLPEYKSTHLVIEGEDLCSAGIPKRWQPRYEKTGTTEGKYFQQICEHSTGNRDSAFTHARRHLAVRLGCVHCPSFGVLSHDAWEKHMKSHPGMRQHVDPTAMATATEAVPPEEAQEIEAMIQDIKKEPTAAPQ